MTPIGWAIVLLLLAVLLVALELVVPSGGLISVLAAAALISSIALVGIYHGYRAGVLYFTACVVAAPFLGAYIVRWFPDSPIGRRIMNLPPENERVAAEIGPYRRDLIGKIGRAKSKMLPSGAIELEGRTYDAVTRGMAVERGQLVEVVEVEGFRIVVQPAPENAQLANAPSDDPLARPLDDTIPDPFDDSLT